MKSSRDTPSGGKVPIDAIAVIFVSQRTALDQDAYNRAATEMEALASRQPGYLGIDSARSSDGLGITVSYWASEDAAKAWRDNAEHAATREKGRRIWYEWYELHVAQVTRSYGWRSLSS